MDTTFPVRIVALNGQPWFVAADVCKALGYNVKADGSVNTHQALKPLAAEEVTTTQISGNRGQHPKLISESGLYKLVMRSDKPQARLFQDWVTRDVLPAIRKDGAYVMGEEKVASGEMDEDEFVLKAMTILQKKVERLKEENAVLLPKAESYDAVVSNDGFYTTTQAAQMLGCHTAVALNRILKTLGWKSKRDTDAPTKKATQAGWLAVRMRQRSGSFRSFPQVFVTPKGIDELRRIFGSQEAAA